jgi:hypothetical protein
VNRTKSRQGTPARRAAALLLVLACWAQTLAAQTFPAGLNADGTFVVDGAGAPYFINGEAAWSLVAGLSNEDADIYLDNRRRKGFNAVLVNAIEHKFAPHAPANVYGVPPFQSPGAFESPTEAYFQHLDWVLGRAEARGITVLLAPLYLGIDCGDEGWCQEVKASPIESLQAYGRFLGRRYGNRKNLIWVIGGDTDPFAPHRTLSYYRRAVEMLHRLTGHPVRDVGEKVRAFAEALRAAGAKQLMTAHNAPEQAARDPWDSAGWLALNNVYTYRPSYLSAEVQYRRQPFMPFFLIETTYENSHDATPLSLRRQAYWAVLSGATAGHVFGNCEVWAFSTGDCHDPWKAQLNSAAARTLALVGRFFTAYPFQFLVPDLDHRVLVGGMGAGEDRAAAARTRDSATVIIYVPSPRSVRVDLTRMSGDHVTARWFDPRDGTYTRVETFAKRGQVDVEPPAAGDWLLVLTATQARGPAQQSDPRR